MLGFRRRRKESKTQTKASTDIQNEILPTLEDEQQRQDHNDNIPTPPQHQPSSNSTSHSRSSSSEGSSSSSSSSSLYEASSLPKNPPSAAVFGQAPGMIAASALHQQANINFNPIPTTTGKCSKLKINVYLDSTIYVAGGNLHGRLELVSSVTGILKIGEIAVELCGYEGTLKRVYI